MYDGINRKYERPPGGVDGAATAAVAAASSGGGRGKGQEWAFTNPSLADQGSGSGLFGDIVRPSSGTDTDADTAQQSSTSPYKKIVVEEEVYTSKGSEMVGVDSSSSTAGFRTEIAAMEQLKEMLSRQTEEYADLQRKLEQTSSELGVPGLSVADQDARRLSTEEWRSSSTPPPTSTKDGSGSPPSPSPSPSKSPYKSPSNAAAAMAKVVAPLSGDDTGDDDNNADELFSTFNPSH
jgi:hypothetical protein